MILKNIEDAGDGGEKKWSEEETNQEIGRMECESEK